MSLIASKDGGMAKAATASETAETREDVAETPLLDTVAAAIKKMVARGKERGYLTYDELNAALPQDQVSSEQIEDTMTMLSELDIIDLDATYGSANVDQAAAAIIKAAEAVGDPDGAAADSEDVVVELSEEAEADGEDGEGEEAGPSLAAMEAQLKPDMLAIFDSVAAIHKKLNKIQDQRIAAIVKGTQLPRATERRYDT